MAEENDNTSTFKKRTWLRWLLIIPLLGGLLYFGKHLLPKEMSLSPNFTEYGELSTDTIAVYAPDDYDTIQEIMPIVLDSLQIEDTATLAVEFQQIGMDSSEQRVDSTGFLSPLSIKENATTAPTNSMTNKLMQLDEKNEETPIATREDISIPKSTLIDDFFFKVVTSDSLQQQFFERNILTSKTVLTILALTGKEILLNGNTADTRELLESMVAESTISGILLCDQYGKIKYASNSKFLNDDIRNIFPNFDLDYVSIGWGKNEQQTVTTMPVFHTFGRIGTVVLMTKN